MHKAQGLKQAPRRSHMFPATRKACSAGHGRGRKRAVTGRSSCTLRPAGPGLHPPPRAGRAARARKGGKREKSGGILRVRDHEPRKCREVALGVCAASGCSATVTGTTGRPVVPGQGVASACPAARCVFTGQREREADFSVSLRDGRSHRGLRPRDPTASRKPRLLLRRPGGQGVSTRTGGVGGGRLPARALRRVLRVHAFMEEARLPRRPGVVTEVDVPRPATSSLQPERGSSAGLGLRSGLRHPRSVCLRTGSSFSRRPRPRDCGRRLVTVSVSGTCRTGGLACPERPGKPREAIPLGGWTHGHSRRGDGTSGDVSSARGAPEKHDRDCPSPKRVPPATPGLLGLTPPAGRAPASGLSPPGVLVLNFPRTTDVPRESGGRPGSRPPTSGSPASSLPTPEGVAAGARDCRQRTTSLARAHGQEDAPRGQPSVAKPRDERVEGLEAMIRTKRRGNSVVVGGHVRPRGHRPRDQPRRVRAAPCPAARKPRGGCAFPRRGLGAP